MVRLVEVTPSISDFKTVLKWASLAFTEKTGIKMDKQDQRTHRRMQSMLEAEEEYEERFNK